MQVQIVEYAKNSRIPKKTLYWMRDRGFIRDPLTDENLTGLALLEELWGRHEILRAQLARLSHAGRRKMIDYADLETRWERYAYSRWKNVGEGRLSMRQVCEEIRWTFGIKIDEAVLKRLNTIRQRVYRMRRKKTQKAEEEFVSREQ